ncbi:hypothetical protein [Desulfovibrio sp. JC010]|uniref:hypothetical protein n=1 Tax=Desulfovibrio sp. JC010 TaxID=2593641 RepID=UPI0013D2BE82|nr:hypothetical protein [Desulfovibrio sp. JC010]NDV27581.1 hypothetical protein [Desulfovibrio sp. JC010]
MSDRDDIIKVLYECDRESYETDGMKIAEQWIDCLFHVDEVRAWIEHGVTDPQEAYDKRLNQEDMPSYYHDDE